ncbi:MAG: HD domain-containing protein [Candidatus Anstonellales archaeon]
MMKSSINSEQEIILAALLHDLGKSFQKRYKTILKNIEGRRKHAEIGAEFIEKNAPELSSVARLVEKHHNEIDEEQIMYVKLGDQISASMRPEKEEDDEEGKTLLPAYFVDTLECDRLCTKFTLDEIAPYSVREHEKIEIAHESSQSKKFEMELVEALKNINKENFEYQYQNISTILRDYTYAVPSYKQHECPVYSIYSHSKASSSLAYILKKKNIKIGDEKTEIYYCLVKLNGIQRFITKFLKKDYRGEVSSKIMRGRSIFIYAITRLLSLEILKELELNIAALLFLSSGKFAFLSDEDPSKKIKNQLEQFNKKLIELGYFPLSASFGIVKLTINLKDQKKDIEPKNYNTIIFEKAGFNSYTYKIDDQTIKNGKKCDRCGEIYTGNKDCCEACKSMEKLGTKCSYERMISGILYTEKTRNIIDEEPVFEFGRFKIFVMDIDKIKNLKINNGFVDLFLKVGKVSEQFNIIDYIKNNLGVDYHLIPLWINDKIDEIIEVEERKKNTPYLAFIKIDIDGLGDKVEKCCKDFSLTLEFITLMEKSMIECLNSGINETIGEKKHEKEKNNKKFYLLYAGGDDITLITRYDYALVFMKNFKENFYKIFHSEDDKYGITYSASIIVEHHRFPVRELSEIGEIGLKEAKRYKKNNSRTKNATYISFVPGDRNVIGNDEYEDLFKVIDIMKENKNISRSLLYNLMSVYLDPGISISKKYKEIDRQIKKLFSKAKMDYIIERHKKSISQKDAEDYNSIKETIEKETFLQSLSTALLFSKFKLGEGNDFYDLKRGD